RTRTDLSAEVAVIRGEPGCPLSQPTRPTVPLLWDEGVTGPMLAEAAIPLERLVSGVQVAGILQGAAGEVVAVRWRGRSFLTLTYRDQNGATGEVVLGRFDDPRLRLQAAGRSHAFDGDGQEWRLAAEALRIRNAALFDPMLAVTSSNLTP